MPERTPSIPDPDEVSDVSGDVIGLYDSDRGVPIFVVADLTADGAWLSIPTGGAVALDSWR